MLQFLSNRVKSFRYAIRGVRDILATEHNAWVHAVATFIVLGVSFWLKLDFEAIALIVMVIILVWISEALNTVLEIVIDIVSPEYSRPAQRAKDIAAAAVLFASIGAVVVGVVLIVPPLIERLVVQ